MKEVTRLRTDPQAIIGEGSRRICYRTMSPGLCAKFYRAPHQFRPGTAHHVRLLVGLVRFSRRLNVNRQEWRYHGELRQRLPADLLSVFPEKVAPVFSPELGWGVVESLILNADGTVARKITQELPRIEAPALRLRVYREAERLLEGFARHDVRFYDLSNLLLQWTGTDSFRLRVADFEPCGRGLPALLTACGWYSRLKLRRRTARFLARLRRDIFIPLPDRSAPAAAGQSLWSRSYRLLARRAGLI